MNKLEELEKEERELLKRLATIRKEKAALKPKMTKAIVVPRDELNKKSKAQLLTICSEMGIEPLSNSTKNDLISDIKRRKRAIARGEAFRKQLNPS